MPELGQHLLELDMCYLFVDRVGIYLCELRHQIRERLWENPRHRHRNISVKFRGHHCGRILGEMGLGVGAHGKRGGGGGEEGTEVEGVKSSLLLLKIS